MATPFSVFGMIVAIAFGMIVITIGMIVITLGMIVAITLGMIVVLIAGCGGRGDRFGCFIATDEGDSVNRKDGDREDRS